MTSILSASYLSLSSIGVTNASRSSSQTQATSQQDTTNLYGEAFSLTLSDSALSTLGGGQCDQSASSTDSLTYASYGKSQNSGSSFEDLLSSLGVGSGSANSSSATTTASASGGDSTDDISQLLKFIEQVLNNTQDSLESIVPGPNTSGNTNTGTATAATSSSNYVDSALASGGPLPAFLKQVDAQLHLDNAHQKALQDIATQYQNANDTPDTVQSIAAALQQAGITG